MLGNLDIIVVTEIGPFVKVRLPLRHQRQIVEAAVRSVQPRSEAEVMNTPWFELTRTRRRAIQRDLTAVAHETGDLQPTE